MISGKGIHRKLYVACFSIFILYILLLGRYCLSTFSKDYFFEIKSSGDFEKIGDGIVYFGRPSCPECKTIEPVLRDIAREERIKIYYFDTEHIRTSEGIDRGVLQKYLLEYQVETVPTIIVIRNGVVVECLSEMSNIGSSRKAILIDALTPYKNMTKYVTPHSVVSYTLLGISILFLLTSFIMPSKVLSRNMYLPIASCDICVMFFSIKNWAMSIGYIEKFGYSGTATDSIASLIAIATTVFSTIVFAIRISAHASEQTDQI